MSDAKAVTDTATNIQAEVAPDDYPEAPPEPESPVPVEALSTHVTDLSSAISRFTTDYSKLGDDLKNILALADNLSTTYNQVAISLGVE